MKLYFSKGACSLAARIIINELKLKAEYMAVNLGTKRTANDEDFRKINPKGAVPTLITDSGETLTENAVILQYLADTSKAFNLLPSIPDFKHYRVLEWLNYIATELHKGFGPLFHNEMPEDLKKKMVIPALESKLKYIDTHLYQNKYLLNEEFTLPDAYLFVILTWALHFKFDFTKWPQVERYFNELKARKSIEVSLKEEGLNL